MAEGTGVICIAGVAAGESSAGAGTMTLQAIGTSLETMLYIRSVYGYNLMA